MSPGEPLSSCGAQRIPGCIEQRHRLRRAVDVRDHRSVVEVDLDTVAASAELAAEDAAAGEAAGPEAEEGEHPTLHRSSSSARASASPGAASVPGRSRGDTT